MTDQQIGLLLVGGGAVLALVGLVVYWGGFSWFGKLPGDINYQGENTRVFVPITSMLIASAALTVLLNLLRRLL